MLVASLDMILSKKRITKALISLRVRADWSAPLLFANHRRQVSHVLSFAIGLVELPRYRKNACEYDPDMLQSQTTEQASATWGREAEH